jgi:hypothetical protein
MTYLFESTRCDNAFSDIEATHHLWVGCGNRMRECVANAWRILRTLRVNKSSTTQRPIQSNGRKVIWRNFALLTDQNAPLASLQAKLGLRNEMCRVNGKCVSESCSSAKQEELRSGNRSSFSTKRSFTQKIEVEGRFHSPWRRWVQSRDGVNSLKSLERHR